MPVKINLLKNRHTLSEAEYQRERLYYRYAMTGLTIAVVITVAVSIWQFILTRQLNTLEEDIGQSTQKLVGLAEANAKQIYLKSRLRLITSFLDDRSVARQSVQKVFSITVPGVSVSSASFETDNVMRIQAAAADVLSLSNLVDYLQDDDEFFLQVVSRGVTRLQDGSYQMDLALTIPKG